jgi:cytoskeleton protein RodZ
VNAELIPELQRLGLRLAQARQAQGISLDDQAERLHMGTEQLRALEEGNRAELPEAVFVVAQARRVAASLGLNIDEDIAALRGNQAFQARPPQRQLHLQPKPVTPGFPSPRPTEQADPTPSRQPLRRLIGLGAALVAAAGLVWAVQHNLSGSGEAPQPLSPGPAQTSSPKAVPGPNQPTAAGPAPPSELVLRSAEPSWLEVRAAGGELLFRGTLEGEKRFPLSGELQVLAGRPDLVTATSGAAEPRPLGPIEAVTWYRFSPQLDPAAEPAPAP